MDAKAVAGLEGILRAYQTLVAQRAENRTPQMEQALAAYDAGGLAAFVKALPPMPAR
jgi:hypothetical protein